MELGKPAYVVLGMIRLGQRTGYEIKRLMDASTRFFWAASYGQIYPELKRLEEAGMVEGADHAAGGRRRRAYSLTPAGESALHAWLTSGAPLHFELRHEGLLRLFFSDAMSPAERVDLLRTIRLEHEQVREQLRAIEPGAAATAANGQRAPLLTLRFGIAYQTFIVDYCADLERLAEQDAPTVSAPRS